MEPWNKSLNSIQHPSDRKSLNSSRKSLNSIFPTKYVIPKSLKFSHWPSKTTHIWSFPNSCEVPSNWPTKTSLKLTAGTPRLEYITIFNRKYIFNPGPFSIAIFSLPECGVPGCTMRWSFFFFFESAESLSQKSSMVGSTTSGVKKMTLRPKQCTIFWVKSLKNTIDFGINFDFHLKMGT